MPDVTGSSIPPTYIDALHARGLSIHLIRQSISGNLTNKGTNRLKSSKLQAKPDSP